MLKFVVMLLCVLCSPRQIRNAPVIKASGVQWTEPKGNGKGNLTLIMIPQNNSCSNETDMLIAVKSDYQVVSQDTQLLNLVINEYQNDTIKEADNNKIQNQRNFSNTNSVEPGQATCTYDNTQSNQETSLKTTEKTACLINDITSTTIKSTSECQNKLSDFDAQGIQNLKGNAVEGMKKDKNLVSETQNDKGSGSLLNGNMNQHDELNVLKNISNESKVYQAVDDLSKNEVNSNPNINTSESISNADFLKYLNSVSDVDQHSELDSAKGLNNANFYEPEKKTQAHEKDQSNSKNSNDLYSKNANAEDVFRFLNAIQARETMATNSRNTTDVHQFLGVTESTRITQHGLEGFSTLNIYKPLNITDNNSLEPSNTLNSKNTNSRLFNDSEINIFKLLNISEPNIGNKMNNGNAATDNLQQNEDSDKNLLKEVVNIISKLKQEPNKEDHNLRPDPLISNQAEELVALDEGDSDTKVKLSKGDYSASSSDEGVLKKQLSLFSSNKIDGAKAEANNNPVFTETLTTCYTVKVSADGNAANSDKLTYSQTTPVIYLGSSENTANNKVEGNTAPSATEIPNTSSPTDIPPALSSDEVLAASSTNNISPEIVSGALSTVSPTCRTSIIYICDSQTVTEPYEQNYEKVDKKSFEKAGNLTINSAAGIQGQVKKITLEPQIDCASYLKTSYSSDNNQSPTKQSNENAHFEDKSVFPLIESSMFLANSNEMPRGKDVPILLNTSSSDYLIDGFLSKHDGKIAKLHANPYDLSNNEEVLEVIPTNQKSKTKQKLDRENKIGGEQTISLKNSKTTKLKKEQVPIVYPGQVLKVRFASRKSIMEQMPSYRSEKFNKNCGSTLNIEPQSDEMESDDKENEIIQGAKTPMANKSTKETNTIGQGQGEIGVSAQSSETTQSEVKNITSSKTKAKVGEASPTENAGPEYVTECKAVSVGSESSSAVTISDEEDHSSESNQETGSVEKETSSTEINKDKEKYSKTVRNQQGKTKPNNDHNSITTKETDVSISKQKYSTNKEDCRQNVKIPADSIKEIVIQIVRNTKKPGGPNSKQCFVSGEDHSVLDDTHLQNNIQRPTLKRFLADKIKPGGYEMELSNKENIYKDDKQSWYPKPVELRLLQNDNIQRDTLNKISGDKIKPGRFETEQSNIETIYKENKSSWYPKSMKIKSQLGSFDKQDENLYSENKNILLDNFYIGKESSQDSKGTIPDSNNAVNINF